MDSHLTAIFNLVGDFDHFFVAGVYERQEPGRWLPLLAQKCQSSPHSLIIIIGNGIRKIINCQE
jgi:hypothetical protein